MTFVSQFSTVQHNNQGRSIVAGLSADKENKMLFDCTSDPMPALDAFIGWDICELIAIEDSDVFPDFVTEFFCDSFLPDFEKFEYASVCLER